MSERSETATVQIKVRLKEATRAQLEQSARANEWPLNREVGVRLEQSLRDDAALGGGATTTLLKRLAADIEAMERMAGRAWHSDYAALIAAKDLLEDAFRSFGPLPPNIEEITAALEEREKARSALAAAALNHAGVPPQPGLGHSEQPLIEAAVELNKAELRVEAAFSETRDAEVTGHDIANRMRANRALADALRERQARA
jgi:hypothetical protein